VTCEARLARQPCYADSVPDGDVT